MVFTEAVTACESADETVRFKYRKAKSKSVVGLRLFESTYNGEVIPYFRLYADARYCDYSPLTKKASIGP